jgi:hypothetical protein
MQTTRRERSSKIYLNPPGRLPRPTYNACPYCLDLTSHNWATCRAKPTRRYQQLNICYFCHKYHNHEWHDCLDPGCTLIPNNIGHPFKPPQRHVPLPADQTCPYCNHNGFHDWSTCEDKPPAIYQSRHQCPNCNGFHRFSWHKCGNTPITYRPGIQPCIPMCKHCKACLQTANLQNYPYASAYINQQPNNDTHQSTETHHGQNTPPEADKAEQTPNNETQRSNRTPLPLLFRKLPPHMGQMLCKTKPTLSTGTQMPQLP